MTLDEAIIHAEEVAEENEKRASWFWGKEGNPNYENCIKCAKEHRQLAEWLKDYKRLKEQEPKWIPVSERLPKTDNEDSINSFNVLLWVKNKTHPEREAQIYLGKLKHVDGDDGSGNFWGMKIEPCEWTIWGWFYFNEPEVIAWMPLPEPYEPQERSE